MYQADKRKRIADRPAAPRLVASTPPVQRAATPAPHHALPASVGIGPPDRTGLPDGLKSGIETLSGLSMADVRVHRGSHRPAAVRAHAYTQGSEIHLAPGQEHHLPHEAWHVVQQKQGRVRPMFDLNGTAINDDAGLEGEADRMGTRALASPSGPGIVTGGAPRLAPATGGVVQGKLYMSGTPLNTDKERLQWFYTQKQGTQARKLAGSQVTFGEVYAQIDSWAKDDVEGTAREYQQYEPLFRAAVGAVLERKKAERGVVAPVSTFDPVGMPRATGPLGEEADKIERSVKLRRRASEVAEDTQGLRTSDKRSFRHRDDEALEYRVTTWGHKLDGGALDHSYSALIGKLRSRERTDRDIAKILADALEGGDYPEGARDIIRKFVAIVHSSELARAAINPTAMYAALRNFANGRATDDKGLFHYLQNTVLFVMAEDDNNGLGGSRMSQHHRGNLAFDRNNAAFKRIAVAEHDALALFAAHSGYDLSAEGNFETFVQQLTRYLEHARAQLFPEQHRNFKKPVSAAVTSSLAHSEATGMEEEIETSESMQPSQAGSSHKRSRSGEEMKPSPLEQPGHEEERAPRGPRIPDMRDAVEFEGHLFSPNVEDVRDLGQCLWDTLRWLGVPPIKLAAAAEQAELTVDAHVNVQELAPLLVALNHQGEQIRIRLVGFDLIDLAVREAITYGDAGRMAYIGLFMQGEDGHFVPGIPTEK